MIIMLVDKPEGVYYLEQINKMIVVIFKQQGYTF